MQVSIDGQFLVDDIVFLQLAQVVNRDNHAKPLADDHEEVFN